MGSYSFFNQGVNIWLPTRLRSPAPWRRRAWIDLLTIRRVVDAAVSCRSYEGGGNRDEGSRINTRAVMSSGTNGSQVNSPTAFKTEAQRV